MSEVIKLVPKTWHSGAWHGDGTTEYEIPDGWEYVDVTGFKRIDGNQYRALIVLRKRVVPDSRVSPLLGER